MQVSLGDKIGNLHRNNPLQCRFDRCKIQRQTKVVAAKQSGKTKEAKRPNEEEGKPVFQFCLYLPNLETISLNFLTY